MKQQLFFTFLLLQFSFFAEAKDNEYIAYFEKEIHSLGEIPATQIIRSGFGPKNRFILLKSELSIKRLEQTLRKVAAFKHLSTNDKIELDKFEQVPSKNKNQWWKDNIELTAANEITKGSEDILVAVLDTGVDYFHQDLKNNIFNNQKEIPSNGIDDDNNGHIDDYYGFNFFSNIGSGMDDNGHGTHCAGLVAANGTFKGVAPKVKILPVKFLDHFGRGDLANAIAGIGYSLKMGANILTNSYGNPNSSLAFKEAISLALEQNVLFIAAAGNAKNDNDARGEYPANYAVKNVISVGASNQGNGKADFSNFGQLSVSLFAPGQSIYSTDVNNQYKTRSGTSFATPIIAGIAALIWSEHPQLTAEEVASTINESTSHQQSLYKFSKFAGVANARDAVLLNTKPPYSPVPRSKLTTIPYPLTSTSPYDNNSTESHLVQHEGATKISLNFNMIDIENGYDYLQIESPSGKLLKKMTGEFLGGKTEFFNGDAVVVKIISDHTETRKGFSINKLQVITEN